MNFRRVIWIALLMLGISMTLGRDAASQTRLGLHVTQEELNIWKQRAKNGPYRSKGDVRPNSPGDWDRILLNANSFRSNPSVERWVGYNGAGCMKNTDPAPSQQQNVKIKDAAFAYLITNDTTYRNAVRNELLTQAGLPGLNFANTTKFNSNNGCLTGTAGPIQYINMYMNRNLFAYDYIRSSLTAAERTTLDAWFLASGQLINTIASAAAYRNFPNRDLDQYSSTPAPQGKCAYSVMYFGGPCRYEWQGAWSNLPAAAMRYVGLVGILTENVALKSNAKRWFKEWLAYMIYPDGSSGELDRWEANAPERGMGYWGGSIAHYVSVADAFARIGDTELYTYSTSAGMFGTVGGPKSLLRVITRYLQYRDHTVKRYATTSAAQVGNPTYLIDGVDGSYHSVNDVPTAIANLFYTSTYISSHYLRTLPGLPGYPSNPAGGQNWWGSDQAIYPGLLFMFGQMEGKVLPYPKQAPAGIDNPLNLRITSFGN